MIAIDIETGLKTITGASHRLVGNDKLGFITLIEGTKQSKTWTKQDVEEVTTKSAAIERIKEKKWKVPEDMEQIKIVKAIKL